MQPLQFCGSKSSKSPDRKIRHRCIVCCFKQSRSFIDGQNTNFPINFLCFSSPGDWIIDAIPTGDAERKQCSQIAPKGISGYRSQVEVRQPVVDFCGVDGRNNSITKILAEASEAQLQI